MINPKDISSNLVTLLKAMPQFVTALGGDASKITSLSHAYPTQVSVANAIASQSPGSALVIWQGSGPGFLGNGEVWVYGYSVILRPPADVATIEDAWYYFCNDIPTGQSQRLRYLRIHPSLYEMDTPRIERRQLILSEQMVMDYFEISFSVKEWRDQ